MSLKYGFLSFLVFCVCLFVFLKNYEVRTQPLVQTLEKSVEKKAEEKPKIPLPMAVQKYSNVARPHIPIAEKNIFSPDRKDFPIAGVVKSNPVMRPQLVLYGVTIAGDFQAASITSPGRPLLKGEHETLTLKVGEKIGAYKLARVHPDRVTLQNTNDSFEVLLYDPKSPKKRMEVRTETKPPAVTTPSHASTASSATIGTSSSQAFPEKASPVASLEKPKEPARQQVVPPPPPLAAKRFPQYWQRRRGKPTYPPTSSTVGVPEQTTQVN